MTIDDLSWMADWAVGVRVWLERIGHAVLDPGRLELLEGIDRWCSISAAARQAGVSYRHAWVMVQEVNRAAGEPWSRPRPGAATAAARLTPHGRLAVAAFRDLQERLRRTASRLRPRLPPDPAAGCVRVAAAISLEEVLGRLLTDYAEERPECGVRAVFGASDELAEQILEGAPADLFLAADPAQLVRLEAPGIVQAGTALPLAENTLVIVGATIESLAVDRPADLMGPAVRRVVLAVPTCPLGAYSQTYLADLGLYDDLRPRLMLADNAQAVAHAVRAGRADAGVVYDSAAALAGGLRVLFHVPRAAVLVRYAGAVVLSGRRPDEARNLLAFLASATAARCFRRCGFLPVREETGRGGAHA